MKDMKLSNIQKESEKIKIKKSINISLLAHI